MFVVIFKQISIDTKGNCIGSRGMCLCQLSERAIKCWGIFMALPLSRRCVCHTPDVEEVSINMFKVNNRSTSYGKKHQKYRLDLIQNVVLSSHDVLNQTVTKCEKKLKWLKIIS